MAGIITAVLDVQLHHARGRSVRRSHHSLPPFAERLANPAAGRISSIENVRFLLALYETNAHLGTGGASASYSNPSPGGDLCAGLPKLAGLLNALGRLIRSNPAYELECSTRVRRRTSRSVWRRGRILKWRSRVEMSESTRVGYSSPVQRLVAQAGLVLLVGVEYML